MAKLPPASTRFHHNLLSSKDVILEAIRIVKPDPALINEDLVELLFAFLEAFDKQKLLEEFVERTHPYWSSAAAQPQRSGALLMRVLKTFDAVNESQANEITRFVDSELLPEKLNEKKWTIVKSLVKISLRFIHDSRDPVKEPNGSYKYRNEGFGPQTIDLAELSKLYGVNL